MNKKLTVALTGALALGMAAPALADTTFSGFLYLAPHLETDFATAAEDTEMFKMDQRFRFKMTNTPSDLVKIVWYAEADNVWGKKEGRLSSVSVSDDDGPVDVTATTKQGGSGFGADGINVETKNAYVMIDVPDSPLSMSLGIQRSQDTALMSNYVANDSAAAKFTYDMVSFGFIMPAADEELYFVNAGYAADAFSLNFDLFYDDKQSMDDITTVGLKVGASVADIGLAASLGFQDGDSAAGFMGVLKADADLGAAKVKALFAYFQDDEDGEGWQVASTDGRFGDMGMYIMFTGPQLNTNAGDKAFTNLSTDGLMAGAVKASFMAGDYNVSVAGGMFEAVDAANGEDEIGTEFGLQVDRAFLDGKVKTSLMANFAQFGDNLGDDLEDAHRIAFSVVTPF